MYLTECMSTSSETEKEVLKIQNSKLINLFDLNSGSCSKISKTKILTKIMKNDNAVQKKDLHKNLRMSQK